jgi:RNA-directed DNA polymerase
VSGPKPFEISKNMVYEAYRRVKANKGAAGVDGQSIEQFEQDLKGNLYKLWNRMSSGSYLPPPVRMVEIPKPGGKGVRVLGVPAVADRIAQTVAAMVLEPGVEKIFHPDSYGYRPGRSALDAVGACRERCWRTDWVIDLDIKGFFDNLDHDLVLRAVAHHTEQRWILLYVQRWLTAPLQQPDGTLVARDRGSPQGSAISPLLANLFMHYAFDAWIAREFPAVAFERYCDDVVVHCRSEAEAHQVREAIAQRLDASGGLQLHPEKTRIVYCRDGTRRGSYEHTSFTFLGFTFRGREARTRDGRSFLSFLPAISKDALNKISGVVRAWRLHRRVNLTFAEVAKAINPVVAGWMQYYGHFRRSALYPLLARINAYLVRWIRKKYKRLRGAIKAHRKLAEITQRYPRLFAHWPWVPWIAR